jgi:hypothetical protein
VRLDSYERCKISPRGDGASDIASLLCVSAPAPRSRKRPSLVELAQKEQERRKTLKDRAGNAKVYSDKDLPKTATPADGVVAAAGHADASCRTRSRRKRSHRSQRQESRPGGRA